MSTSGTGSLRCPRCLAPTTPRDLAWDCAPGCGRNAAHTVDLDKVRADPSCVSSPCPERCPRRLTSLRRSGCGHAWDQPLEAGGRRDRHVVLLAVEPAGASLRAEDRGAVAAHVEALAAQGTEPASLHSWVSWRTARPGIGWLPLSPGEPIRLARPASGGSGRRTVLHVWADGMPSDSRCPGRPPLSRRLALADAVILLIPARSLLARGTSAMAERVAGLTAALPGPGQVALFHCLTGAEALLSRLGEPAAALERHLPAGEPRSRWLDRCAGFDLLAPTRGPVGRHNATMVAGEPFARLTDLSSWSEWVVAGNEPTQLRDQGAV